MPPAERSPSDQRTPSSPCELVCGLAPQIAGPSCLQPLAPPPVPSPHEALWPCTAVSMEMRLYLLPGLPLVRTALATFSPGGRWWDSITVAGGPPPTHRLPLLMVPPRRIRQQGPTSGKVTCPQRRGSDPGPFLHMPLPLPWLSRSQAGLPSLPLCFRKGLSAHAGSISLLGCCFWARVTWFSGVPLHGGSPLEPLFGTQQLSLGLAATLAPHTAGVGGGQACRLANTTENQTAHTTCSHPPLSSVEGCPECLALWVCDHAVRGASA